MAWTVERATAGTQPGTRPGTQRERHRRLLHSATVGVLVFSAALPLAEVARVALLLKDSHVLSGIVLAAVFLVPHLVHCRAALRGEPVARGWVGLLVMAAAMAAGLILIGEAWTLTLAALNLSMLIVLPRSWALPLCLVALGVCWSMGFTSSQDTRQTFSMADLSDVSWANYFLLACLFRTVCLAVPIWLVATLRELWATQDAVGEHALRSTRDQFSARLADRVAPGLGALTAGLLMARAMLARGDRVRARASLAEVTAGSRRALHAVRSMVREDPRPGAGRTPSWAGPVRQLLPTRRSAMLMLLGVYLMLFTLLTARAALYTIGQVTLVGWALETLGGLAVAGPVLALSLTMIERGRPRWAGWVYWGVLAVGATGFLLADLGAWLTHLWFVVAAGALAWRGAARLAAAVAPVVLGVAYMTVRIWGFYSPAGHLAASLYIAAIALTGGLAAAAATVVARAIADLETSRAELATQVADIERSRISRDLHDVLGHSLSALSLKGDLAVRLLDGDPARATAEVDAMSDIALALTREIDGVTEGDRTTSFDIELATGTALLRQAGIDVQTQVDGVGRLGADADALLGWAVREGITNILRHSDARTVRIAGTVTGTVTGTVNDTVTDTPTATTNDTVTGARVALELVNDAARPGGEPGSGLAGLAARAEAAHGALSAGPDGEDRYRLRLELPVVAR